MLKCSSVAKAIVAALAFSALTAPRVSAVVARSDGAAPAVAPTEPIVELGAARWGRSLDSALAESRAGGKPAFILFQEIPGCSTCQGFGRGTLSEPLVVEAIETFFVPVAIHNNKPGADEAALRRFGEPAWNNPVVRLVDADGKDLVPRRDGLWTTGPIVARMVAALEASKREVPRWLRQLAAESETAAQERAVFAMHCFWEGEAKLAALDGVVRTRAGFVDGREVVEVTFDPRALSYAKLAQKASGQRCADVAYVASDAQRSAAVAAHLRAEPLAAPPRAAPASDQSHALGESPLRLLPLTAGQRSRANAAVAAGEDATAILSPRQRELLGRVEAALRASPQALAGLAPPENAAELAGYERLLRAKLGG